MLEVLQTMNPRDLTLSLTRNHQHLATSVLAVSSVLQSECGSEKEPDHSKVLGRGLYCGLHHFSRGADDDVCTASSAENQHVRRPNCDRT